MTFWKVKTVTGEGRVGQNGENSLWGKTGHLQESGPKMAKMLGGVNFQHFGPPLRPKKCFQQQKNGVGPQLTNISGGVKHGHLLRRRPKKRPKFNMV